MPKLKTNKAAKKRYSLTATGKVKRTKSNRRHLFSPSLFLLISIW